VGGVSGGTGVDPDPLAAIPRGPTGYAAFSAEEYRRRDAAVDGLRTAAGLDAIVVYGSGNARHELQYLTAWPARQEGYLVTGPGRPPSLHVQLYNHVPNAREMSVVEDVRWGGTDSTAAVAGEIAARGARKVGLVGAIPYQAHRRLTGATAGVDWVDLTGAFRRMRLVKSAEEIDWTARAAAVCDLAIDALVRAARPGLREDVLGSIVENAYGAAGGQHGICFLATAPMTGGGRAVPAQNWSDRVIREGDAVVIELSAGLGGYTGQVLRTVAVGEPTADVRELHAVADAAFEAIVAAARPGAPASDLLAAAGLIDAAGLTVIDDVVHGYGGGYLAPVLRTPATSHGPAPELILEPGMMLVVQPNVVTPDGRLGVQTGELVLITEDRARSLHTAPRGLLRATPTA
jgi:Xaa-Pro dipeptidase